MKRSPSLNILEFYHRVLTFNRERTLCLNFEQGLAPWTDLLVATKMTYWLIETAFKQKQTLQPTADVLSTGLWRLGGKRFQATLHLSRMTARSNPQQRQGEEQSTGRRMSDFLLDFPLGPFYPPGQKDYPDVINKSTIFWVRGRNSIKSNLFSSTLRWYKLF